MMAKKLKDRYNSIEEVLVDVIAVRDGQPPLRARHKFNMDTLTQLEQGIAIDMDDDLEENSYREEVVAKYKVGMVILAALIAVLIIALILIATGK